LRFFLPQGWRPQSQPERGFLLDTQAGTAVLYRLYTPADFPALYAIEEICFQPPFRFPRRYMRHLADSLHTITWIAEDDGQMAGFAIADCAREAEGVIAYIQTIEVLPPMCGRGIGNELLRRIEDSVRQREARAIWLHVDSQNGGAIRLYESHGFACEGRKENYYAHGRAALIYSKSLEPRA
jgi:ribosomal-protein-alanine N-acetyltransferase